MTDSGCSQRSPGAHAAEQTRAMRSGFLLATLKDSMSRAPGLSLLERPKSTGSGYTLFGFRLIECGFQIVKSST